MRYPIVFLHLALLLLLVGCDGGLGPDGQTPDPLEVVWTYQTEGPVRTTPVRLGGYILFGSDDGTVYCLDEEDGSRVWAFPTGGPVRSDVENFIVSEIYFASDSGRVFCVDTWTGLARWTYDAGHPVRTTPCYTTTGRLYFADTVGHVHCVEAGDGTDVWTAQVPAGVESDPWVDAERVYFGCDDGSVYALDAATGADVWSYATGGPVTAPMLKLMDRIIVGSQDGFLYSLNPEDGALNWRYDAGSAIQGAACPRYGADAVYVGTDDGLVVCVGLDGTPRSEFASGAAVTGAPDGYGPVYAVVFGNHDGRLFQVDDGEEDWRFDVSDSAIQASPANFGDMIFVGADDGVMYRLNPTGE